MNHQTDSQLLRAYAEQCSEAAFAELVRRHVDFVYSAARRMVGDSHLAEDVTQGVFLALAKNPGRLTDRLVLSGWLHRTAQNIAAQTVRTDVRRRAREQEAAAMNELLSAGTDASWEQIAPHLDAALGELTDTDRDAVLLRYFEHKSAREMAQALGVSEDAAQKRVSRAVERLREFFVKRGVTVGASGLVVIISTNAVQAAPEGLAATLTGASLLGIAKGTGTTFSVLKLMAMTKLKIGAISAIVAAAVVAPLVTKHITGEPSYGGKTVTAWLERLKLYSWEKLPDGGTQMVRRSPETIAADPAVRALLAIGPRAVPVLMKRIAEPGEIPQTMPPAARWNVWLRWKLLREPGPSGSWSFAQMDRKHAAGFALLALGAKSHGGFSRFLEAYAAAPQFTSIVGGRLSGMPVGVATSSVVQSATDAFPQLRSEIVVEAMAALDHTNAIYRQSALEAARVFPEELLKRRELLLKLTLDDGELVKATALGNLLMIVQTTNLHGLMSPAEVQKAAEAVLEAPSTSERNRDLAQTVIHVAKKQVMKPIPSPVP